jgi:hypothetical protein
MNELFNVKDKVVVITGGAGILVKVLLRISQRKAQKWLYSTEVKKLEKHW